MNLLSTFWSLVLKIVLILGMLAIMQVRAADNSKIFSTLKRDMWTYGLEGTDLNTLVYAPDFSKLPIDASTLNLEGQRSYKLPIELFNPMMREISLIH